MPEPTSMYGYLQRYRQNEHIVGLGVETRSITPCPFCAAPNFWSYRIIEVKDVICKDTVCGECERGARTLIKRTEQGTMFEVVQTSGRDQPAWLTPKMRRLTDEEKRHAGQ